MTTVNPTPDDLVRQTNQRLKAESIRITIQKKGNSLYLRGTFPPKPESIQEKPYQQTLTLGLRATPGGIRQAEVEARKVGKLLGSRQFDWTGYLNSKIAGPAVEIHEKSIAAWVDDFKTNYFTHHAPSANLLDTWQSNFQTAFNKLPDNQPLTAEILEEVLKSLDSEKAIRSKAFRAFSALARFANLAVNFEGLRGTYRQKQVRYDLPDDGFIVECFYTISDPAWRWAFGILATYGIAQHEIFYLDTQQLQGGGDSIFVLEGTRLKSREVYPFYPEWVDLFELRNVQMPSVKSGKNNTDYGKKVWYYLKRKFNLPIKLSDLRHRCALRARELGLPNELAAQYMEHSFETHTNLYPKLINEPISPPIELEQDRFQPRLEHDPPDIPITTELNKNTETPGNPNQGFFFDF